MRIKKCENVMVDVMVEYLSNLQKAALNNGAVVNVDNRAAMWLIRHGYCTHLSRENKSYDEIAEG